ncbi:MAG: CBS domain-containing protein [Anaerolineae bacterium]|nr:CBS domain-containing protein [Anaerolineae bacterium]
MSPERDLQWEQVGQFDLKNFTTVEIGTSVKTTITKMRQENQHCAIILDKGSLAGIFTDRDILRKVVDSRESWDLPIDDVMTPAPLTVQIKDRADLALALMDFKHFRNVPVLDDDGKVMGNITHYAIIKYLSDRFPTNSIYNPPPNPDQVPRKSEMVPK